MHVVKFDSMIIKINLKQEETIMKDFIEYLTDQFEAGKNDIARLEADGRKDDADFAKQGAW